MSTATMTQADEKIESVIDKIIKLGEMAENATPEEMENAQRAVSRLMAKHALDQARIDAKKAKGQKQAIIEREFDVKDGSWSAPWHELMVGLTHAADIRLLLRKGKPTKMTTYTLIGYEDDVDQAITLFASLQLQAGLALNVFSKTDYAPSYYSASQKYNLRRDFVFGYVGAALQRVRSARREVLEAEKARDLEIAQRLNAEGADAAAVAEAASSGAEIVLATKKERVTEYYDEKYSNIRRSRVGNVSYGFTDAYSSGADEGRRANVNGRKAVTATGPGQIG